MIEKAGIAIEICALVSTIIFLCYLAGRKHSGEQSKIDMGKMHYSGKD